MKKCEICGQKDFIVIDRAKDPDGITKQYYYLERCGNCGLCRVKGDISYSFLSKFYSSDYYPEGFVSSLVFNFFSRIRVRKISRFKHSGDLLDVGCGDGRFLFAAKKAGYGAYGLETSTVARRVAKSKGIYVYDKGLLEQNFKAKKFDIVTLWQVLEHIDDPNRYLSKIKKIIKKDGLLYIGVPNIQSTQYFIFRNKWFHLDLPRHLFAYSPKTLKEILEKNGFDVFRIDHDYLEYNPFGFFQSCFNVILPVFNFPYKVIKREKKNYGFSIIFSFIAVYLLFLPVFLLSFIFYFVDILISRGATIGVYVRLRNQ